MPIKNLTKRLVEVGRLRLGQRVPVLDNAGRPKVRNGQPVLRPERLDTWRLTSPHSELLEHAAGTYGGDVKPWQGAPTDQAQYELLTDSDWLAVLVPPGQAISQWMEHWSGGGCKRRCDGETEITGDPQPCLCAQETGQPQDYTCKPTTRLNVVLQGVPAIGVWRCELHGWYGATELLGMAELLEAAGQAGRIIPAKLKIDQREIKRPGEPTRRFVVPVLLPDPHTLTELTASATRAALEAPDGPAAGEVDPAGLSAPTTADGVGYINRRLCGEEGLPTHHEIDTLLNPTHVKDFLDLAPQEFKDACKAVVGFDRWQSFWKTADVGKARSMMRAALKGLEQSAGADGGNREDRGPSVGLDSSASAGHQSAAAGRGTFAAADPPAGNASGPGLTGPLQAPTPASGRARVAPPGASTSEGAQASKGKAGQAPSAQPPEGGEAG